jgi:DNA-binding NarL/FixJ family response regulator
METINIILVEDNLKFRASLKELLEKKYNYKVIAEASDGKEFNEHNVMLNPDIVLMDLSMPNMDGFEATKKYFWNFPHSKIIALTASVEIAFLDSLIEAGFKGCVFKDNVFNEIDDAICAVTTEKLWFKHVKSLRKNN